MQSSCLVPMSAVVFFVSFFCLLFFILRRMGKNKVCLLHIIQSWLWRKTCRKRMNTWMKKYAATILVRIRRENCEMLHWSKTRGRPQEDASTHESLSGANKRTATEVVIGALWAKSELMKKNETQNKKGAGLHKCIWKTSCTILCSSIHTNAWAGWSLWQRSNTAW